MKNINSQYHFTPEDLKEVLRDCYFTPSRVQGKIKRGSEFCEKYAVQKLWFVRKIKFKDYVWTQPSVRELIVTGMAVSDLDMAEQNIKTDPGRGRHQLVAKVLFFYLVFGDELWNRHNEGKITSDDIAKAIKDFIESAKFDFDEGTFETEVLEYGRKKN